MRLLLLFYFVSITTHSCCTETQARCHYDEQSALLQFKQSFTFNKSYSKAVASWNSQNDCCSWDGVECDESTHHVIGLHLTNTHLYGSINTITNTLFTLVHLQTLDLSYNNFNLSRFPSGISRLSKLTYLNLSSSFLSGQISSEISQLSALSCLDLSYNSELELREPNLGSLVENLTTLETLDFTSLQIYSTVPNSLANLSSLTSLVLESCGLYGEFPSRILQLPSLQFLNLRWNYNLTGYLPEFHRNNTCLKSLMLRSTCFSGEMPSSIGNLAFLNTLDIQDCNFSGLVPSSLANLTHLTLLNMGRNQFKIQTYFSFSLLDKLTILVLHGINNLNEETLFSLQNLTQLSYLDLSSTQLVGEIPYWLMNLTHLSVLDLGSNHLNGYIPSWIMNLTRLTQLDLSFNKLQGPIPVSIFELKNLQQLRLHSNSLNGTMELNMLFRLKNLTLLHLSSNNLSLLSKNESNNISDHQSLEILGLASCNLQEFPYFLQSQYALRWLDLSSNNIHGQVPKWLSNLRSLQFVKFSHNFLTGFEEHPTILPLARLRTLDLKSNMLQGSLPIPPASINFYFVSKNNLTGEIPPMVCNLSSLHGLDLSVNSLTGLLPECLGNFGASLSILNLRGNNFYGTIPQSWTTGSKLRMIDLSNNKFQGPLPRALANCRMLRFLNFGDNQIRDIFPYWLGRLPELRILILRSNEFNGALKKPAADSNFDFSKLCIIDISNNSFSGKLPSEYFQNLKAMKVVGGQGAYLQENLIPDKFSLYASLGNYFYSMTLNNKGTELVYRKILDALTAIDFSSNQFEGEIPESIGNLEGLHVLNLSKNFFTGHISSSLGNINSLESLDLSQNRLSGGIPQQLAQLDSLAVFSVSYNRLTGPIPQGKQFNTFSNNSYEGNWGLCGVPLQKRCGTSAASPEWPPGSIEEEEENFEWKMVMAGYVCGLVNGVAIAHTVTMQKHCWFMRTCRRWQQKRQTRRGHTN